jgi:hypothetical protein
MRVQPLYRSRANDAAEALNHYESLQRMLRVTSEFAAGRSAVAEVRDAAAAYAADAAAAAELDHTNISEIVEHRHKRKKAEFVLDPTPCGPLGPLWPHGEPAWYTRALAEQLAEIDRLRELAAQSPTQAIDPAPPPPPPEYRLVLGVEVSECPNSEEVIEALAALHAAMNEFHIEHGGNGLIIDDWRLYAPVHEPAGVES